MLTLGSLFSGIGGFDEGFRRAGIDAAWQVEIDPDAQRVLRARFDGGDGLEQRPAGGQEQGRRHPGGAPVVHADVTGVGSHNLAAVDVVCGGFPCQDLSVAGKRAGLAGSRSGLWFEFHRILAELAPRWVVIENVPGLLSSNGGADMAVVLRGLAELGYGWAYRVLDAQYFGVAQRRRRVFIVGCLGNGAAAAQVLFEPESCGGDSPPSRAPREGLAASLTSGSHPGSNEPGRRREDDVNLTVAHAIRAQGQLAHREDIDTLVTVGVLTATGNAQVESGQIIVADTVRSHPRPGSNSVGNVTVAHTLKAEGFDASEDGTGRGVPLTVAYGLRSDAGREGVAKTPSADAEGKVRLRDPGFSVEVELSPTLDSTAAHTVGTLAAVRRLTPTECERLQGFPDGWTEGHSDSARYRMLGNAVCVPVAEWIGRRIAAYEGAAGA